MPDYSGHAVKAGEHDAALVAQLQDGLHALGYGPFQRGVFDANMTSIVRLFQSQHVDRSGRPLDADGIVGAQTWSAIFGADTAPAGIVAAPNALAQKAVEIAQGEVGTMEKPVGSNSGPRVDQYLSSVGIAPGEGSADDRYWCMAFAYFCVDSAAHAVGVANPLYRTAGVIEQWNKCASRPGVRRITQAEALAEPSLVQPGQILILDHGGGLGHTGIIVAVDAPHLTVVEGNASGKPNDRNGTGVFRTTFRKTNDGLVKGYLAFD